jgi:hypothetical protein
MFKLLQFFQFVLARAERRDDRDEAYLAGAVDIQDLERRLRTIDERGRDPMTGIALGLYTR